MTFAEIAEKIKLTEAKKARLMRAATDPKWIIQTLKNRLNLKGEAADGKKLRTDKAIKQSNVAYSDFTMLMKRADNQPLDKVTLKDSGAFQDSFKFELKKLEFELTANFRKGEEHIGENFLKNYFPDEFEDVIMSLSESEKQELLNRQINAVRDVII
jgi:hypothetical protein